MPMPALNQLLRLKVNPNNSDSYSVQNNMSPDVNAAIVRYTMGSKTCVFSTTFVNQLIGGGLFPGAPSQPASIVIALSIPARAKCALGAWKVVCHCSQFLAPDSQRTTGELIALQFL